MRPCLLGKKKFDFRFYVLVTGVNKMNAYLSFQGLARLCTEDYADTVSIPKTETELLAHLTNFSLNKHSEKFTVSEDFEK